MPSEKEILKVIHKITPNSKKYLHDDAAIIENDLIVTTDTLVENTHFTLKTYTSEEIGWKALAVNLSDIAAMGGKPLYALISLTLPKNTKLSWIKNLYKGIIDCAKKYKTQIIGGNLARGKEISVTITIIGKIVKTPRRGVSTGKRSNAKSGDLVFATGTFGDSACGFLSLRNKLQFNKLIRIHKKPIPQITLGQKIVRACFKHAPALMDASDGLADCLIQIANESKVKIIVEKDKIPTSKEMKKATQILRKDLLKLALYGGEDYQLVGTASKKDCKKLKKIKGIKIIGKVLKGSGAFLQHLKQNNNNLVKLDMKKTYAHFK